MSQNNMKMIVEFKSRFICGELNLLQNVVNSEIVLNLYSIFIITLK